MVYALVDPLTNELRYIGQTASGLRRARYHLWHARRLLQLGQRAPQHVYGWLFSLIRAGVEPETLFLEEGHANDEELDAAERFFIEYFRFIGSRLTNMSDGGGSTTRGMKFAEQGARWSRRQKQRMRDPRLRAEFISAFTAKSQTEMAAEKRRKSVKASWDQRRLKFGPNGRRR